MDPFSKDKIKASQNAQSPNRDHPQGARHDFVLHGGFGDYGRDQIQPDSD
jgi:hypothetical protein